MKDFVVPASTIDNPLIQLDGDLNIINVNQAAAAAFGKAGSDLIGKSHMALCEELNCGLPGEFFNAVQQQSVSKFETSFIQAGNKVKHYSWSIIYLADADKQCKYILHGNDITSYRELLREDEGLQAYLEHILDNIPCYIYWKDINSVYLGCNKKFAQAAGFASPAEVIGKTDYDFVWGETEAHLFRQSDLEVLKGIPKLDFEEPQLQADGKQAIVLANKVPMRNKAGEIIGILGIYLDITDRKKAEIELKEAKNRAEIANHTKSEFLAVASHELRLPLTAILGMAQLLSGENLSSQYKEQIADIIKSGEHLHALINDILDFAKLEAGKLELHPAPVDLKQIVEEIATMLSNQAKTNNIELLVDYPEDIPHRLIGDARALRQVLINLCGNALKFTERGHIIIKVDCLEKTASHATLTISVEDTGIGIAQDKLNMIFDRFSQVDSSRSRRYSGIGLGLTITKQYITAMGGNITVKSVPGEGSTFICTVPFELQSSTNHISPWNDYKSNVRILIVDDSLRGRILQKQIASSICQTVLSSEVFNELRIAQQSQQPYHIVIIDQHLESIDAFQLAENIRQQRLEQPMMLLIIPGHSLPAENAAKAAGFFGCIAKPAHPTEFLIDLTAAWEQWRGQQHCKATKNENYQPHILLVEDDEIVQRVHYLMLKQAGYEVEVAKNGEQALTKFNNHSYDLIFMDIGLPDITGFDVVREIRRRENDGQHIPIIGLTGYSDEEDRKHCLAAGMNAVAVKPVKPNELKKFLQHWVFEKVKKYG